MAKSKIIKELANGTIDTMTALKRAKVLLMELNNDRISDWITYEMTGYPNDADLPDYRIQSGILIGSYTKGSLANYVKYTNVSIPLGKMPNDFQKELLTVKITDGVNALKQLKENCAKSNTGIGKQVPADLFPNVAYWNDDPYMMFTTLRVKVGNQVIDNVLSNIESRLIDVLANLEREFGLLDDLDIDTSEKNLADIEKITNRIEVIMYTDNSINIGDGNTIKSSEISSGK